MFSCNWARCRANIEYYVKQDKDIHMLACLDLKLQKKQNDKVRTEKLDGKRHREKMRDWMRRLDGHWLGEKAGVRDSGMKAGWLERAAITNQLSCWTRPASVSPASATHTLTLIAQTQSCEVNKWPFEWWTVTSRARCHAMRHRCVAMVMGLLSDPGSAPIHINATSAVFQTSMWQTDFHTRSYGEELIKSFAWFDQNLIKKESILKTKGFFFFFYVSTHILWRHPPVWWCSDGRTVPWWRPQKESPSSVCQSIRPSGSWWPRRSPSSPEHAGDRCTPPQTPLHKHTKERSNLKWIVQYCTYA